jgi:ribonuclease VapC
VIVDSSAIIAIMLEEPEKRPFLEAIDRAVSVRLSAANFVEVGIVTDSRHAHLVDARVATFLTRARIIIEPVTEAQARLARDAHRRYGRGSGHRARLNFGDCFAYALARDKDEPLLFKGTDFGSTDVRVAV